MASMSDGYPFIFQMIDKCTENEYMLNTLQYRFKSMKSHHTYIVRVEHYPEHAYCLKFLTKQILTVRISTAFVLIHLNLELFSIL